MVIPMESVATVQELIKRLSEEVSFSPVPQPAPEEQENQNNSTEWKKRCVSSRKGICISTRGTPWQRMERLWQKTGCQAPMESKKTETERGPGPQDRHCRCEALGQRKTTAKHSDFVRTSNSSRGRAFSRVRGCT